MPTFYHAAKKSWIKPLHPTIATIGRSQVLLRGHIYYRNGKVTKQVAKVLFNGL
jgi:uncharacterized Zn finger protein